MVTAMWYVLRTGCPWRDVPECYGPWRSVHTRWRRWCESGLWDRLLAELAKGAEGELRHVDGSHVKLHQDGTNPSGGQEQQAIGRTKGGLNTKLVAVVDSKGRAVALSVCAGPRHDLHAIAPLCRVLRGKRVVADKGFDADSFRLRLRRIGARPYIPPRRGRRNPAAFHRGYYRRRHRVENFFARIKRHRRVSTRYEKRSDRFLAFVKLAAVLDWLSHRV